MKKIAAYLILVIILLSSAVYSKSVLYIGDKLAGIGNCSDLNDNDNKIFCTRLSELGYDIKTIDGKSVKQGTEIWKNAVKDTDMIFVGYVTEDTLIIEGNENFCENIKNWSLEKKLFLAGNSVYRTDNIQDCASYIGVVDSVPINNTIQHYQIYVQNSTHYITKKYNESMQYNFYKTPQNISFYNGTDMLLGVYGGYMEELDIYPVLKINPNSIFWGFGRPEEFTEMGWEIFNRSVEYLMGDIKQDINILTIPHLITKNTEFLLIAKTKENITGNGTLSYNSEEINIEFDERGGYWKSTPIKVEGPTQFEVNIGEFSETKLVEPGNINVSIISGDFKENYTIKAIVSEQDATVMFRVLFPNLTEYDSGELDNEEIVYKKQVSLPNDTSELILEVTAEKDGNYGGSYKILTPSAETGLGYSIEPEELVITTNKNKTITKTFKIGSGRGNLTNIKIRKSGEIALDIGIVKGDMATTLLPERYTTFRINIDMSNLYPGRYSGSIIVEADEHMFIVPIRIYYLNTTGHWLKISPRTWKIDILAGMDKTSSFVIENSGIYPSTDLEMKVTGTIHNMISLLSQPLCIEPGESGEVKLLANARNVDPGEYKGSIELKGAMGTVTIMTKINVIDKNDFNIDEIEERLNTISENVDRFGTSEQKELFESIVINVDKAKEKWESGNYSEALDIISVIESNLYSLEYELENVSVLENQELVFIAAGLIAIIVIAYLIYKYKDKVLRKGSDKRKKSYLPSEENYRTEYY